MIESGSHTPGVSATMFGLPPNTALRYEMPDPALRRYLPSYIVMDSERIDGGNGSEWMLPGWAQMWIVLTDGPIAVTIGARRYDPMPPASLYGVTSRAMPLLLNGGVSVRIDISPLGWARLFRTRADRLRDRLTPLQTVMEPALVGDLIGRLRASDQGAQVKPVLDDFFAPLLTRANPDEAAIAAMMGLMSDDRIPDVATLAQTLGIDPGAMRRLSNRYFGFAPKTLMMRARFIRRFVAMMERRGEPEPPVPNGYHDASHFIRDGRRFLGMTPRRFLAIDTPYLDAALRARAFVREAAARR